MTCRKDTRLRDNSQLCVDNHVLMIYPQHMVEEDLRNASGPHAADRCLSAFRGSVFAAPALIRRQWKAVAVAAILIVGVSWVLGSSINSPTTRALSPRGIGISAATPKVGAAQSPQTTTTTTSVVAPVVTTTSTPAVVPSGNHGSGNHASG